MYKLLFDASSQSTYNPVNLRNLVEGAAQIYFVHGQHGLLLALATSAARAAWHCTPHGPQAAMETCFDSGRSAITRVGSVVLTWPWQATVLTFCLPGHTPTLPFRSGSTVACGALIDPLPPPALCASPAQFVV